jgi:hypothetical protein
MDFFTIQAAREFITAVMELSVPTDFWIRHRYNC